MPNADVDSFSTMFIGFNMFQFSMRFGTMSSDAGILPYNLIVNSSSQEVPSIPTLRCFRPFEVPLHLRLGCYGPTGPFIHCGAAFGMAGRPRNWPKVWWFHTFFQIQAFLFLLETSGKNLPRPEISLFRPYPTASAFGRIHRPRAVEAIFFLHGRS